MKSCVINPIGTSPMIVTELYRYLRNVDPGLRDVIIIHTKNGEVLRGAKIAKASLLSNYNDVRVQLKETKTDDIGNDKELEMFIELVIDSMITERDKYNVDKFYLNVTGGRKIQTIALSIFAGVLGISEVYNVIDRNVSNFNEFWEREKYNLTGFENAEENEDLISEYNRRKDSLDGLFYPDPNVLNFLKVPVVIMPQDERNILKKLIMGISVDDEDFTKAKLAAYQSSGLITYDKSRTHPTELGNIILKYLR
ncbi:CRISPR-associated protein Csx14 [Cuniculiplasma sp. SKW4]|uniref:CRISPR-associated protein Csx14 n=1 Tax=Cuniculiplasma sp. SKW4 TaxID=3400171 RepID=UPI003FD5F90C